MPVLRSREIPSPPDLTSSKSKPKTLKLGFIPPSTPAKSVEPSLTQSPQETLKLGSDLGPNSAPPRRRSLRLASKPISAETFPNSSSCRRKRRRNLEFDEENGNGNGKNQFQFNLNAEVKNLNDFGCLGLGLYGEDGIRVSEGWGSLGLGLDGEDGIRVSDSEEERDFEKVFEDKGFERETMKRGRRRSGFEGVEEVKQENGFFRLRSGLRVSKRNVEDVVVTEPEGEVKDVKGKAILIEKGSDEGEGGSERKLDDEASSFDPRGNKTRSWRRLTREEKGKGKLIEHDVTLNTEDSDMFILNPGSDCRDMDLNPLVNAYEDVKYGGSVDNGVADTTYVVENVALEGSKWVNDSSANENDGQVKSMKGRFKDIARRNASKFAHFDAREEEENHVDSEAEVEEELDQPGVNGEDWPGPFSTAIKIIRDRDANLGGEVHNLGSGKGGMALVLWTPKRQRDHQWPKRAAPSLQDMCLSILAKNVDAITSLMYVPDVLRHKLTQMLCDSRRMSAHFLDLLLEGSPSEIRLPDCSWLEEEKFEKSFEGCDTKNTTVLQLDLCGQCLSDSSLLKALVPKGLPSLTMVSLRGACRISDVGLSALVSSAPTLRSMNLSQCSLLTDVGINSIADSLGSILRELYLDDCESLDAMRILPGLERLKCLEVLSIRGIGSVSDKFIKQLITTNGQNMKELVLANCVKLTDSSLKVIAETCSQLCVLDLSHLTKLTDVGMVYLANGCRGIEDLKLCRSPFSDDAIAAFIEASGESLKELSFNNIAKVGQNTTISLSKRCKNLQSLDLSWCRNLTDEALGLIADSCLSLRVLKLFGCTQVTRTFLEGHSNPNLQIIGLKLTPILDHIKRPDFQQGPLHYSAVPSF